MPLGISQKQGKPSSRGDDLDSGFRKRRITGEIGTPKQNTRQSINIMKEVGKGAYHQNSNSDKIAEKNDADTPIVLPNLGLEESRPQSSGFRRSSSSKKGCIDANEMMKFTEEVRNTWWFKAILMDKTREYVAESNLLVELGKINNIKTSSSSSPRSIRDRSDATVQRHYTEETYMKHPCLEIRDFSLRAPDSLNFLKNLPQNLISLELRNCGLTTSTVSECFFFSECECQGLIAVCLADNQLTSIPLFLEKLGTLQYLDLSNNKITHVPLQSLPSQNQNQNQIQNQNDNSSLVDSASSRVAVAEKALSLDFSQSHQFPQLQQGHCGAGTVTGTRTCDDVFKRLKSLQSASVSSCSPSSSSSTSISVSVSVSPGPGLVYLNLTNNPRLTSLDEYRDNVLDALPSLLALDGHLVCDEERIDKLFRNINKSVNINSGNSGNTGNNGNDVGARGGTAITRAHTSYSYLFDEPYCAGHPQYRLPSFLYDGRLFGGQQIQQEQATTTTSGMGGTNNPVSSPIGSPIIISNSKSNSISNRERERASPPRGGSGNVLSGSGSGSGSGSVRGKQVRRDSKGLMIDPLDEQRSLCIYRLQNVRICLYRQYTSTSPAVVVQRRVRIWLKKRELKRLDVKDRIIKFQAHVRRWLLHSRCRKDMVSKYVYVYVYV